MGLQQRLPVTGDVGSTAHYLNCELDEMISYNYIFPCASSLKAYDVVSVTKEGVLSNYILIACQCTQFYACVFDKYFHPATLQGVVA